MATVNRDPVCGMELNVEETQSQPQAEYEGETFYFCSESCREQFDERPELYANKAGMREAGNE